MVAGLACRCKGRCRVLGCESGGEGRGECGKQDGQTSCVGLSILDLVHVGSGPAYSGRMSRVNDATNSVAMTQPAPMCTGR